jgi:hypothetical protein
VFLLGVAIAIVAGLRATDDRDVWTDVSKAGVSIALITVAGAVASVAVKRVDDRRARETELRRLLHVVLGAYNDVKGARRNLRAIGLPIGADSRSLHDDQVLELRSVMTHLNKAQLALEASAREIPHSGLFRHPEVVVSVLRGVEDFINKSAIRTWERSGGSWWPGNKANAAGLDGLNPFFRGKEDGFGQFEPCVSTPLDRLIELIKDEIANAAAPGQPVAGGRV